MAFRLIAKSTDGAFFAMNKDHVFHNTATVEGTVRGESITSSTAIAQQKLKSNVINKSAVPGNGNGYNYETHEQACKIDVNKNKMTMITSKAGITFNAAGETELCVTVSSIETSDAYIEIHS